MRLFILATMALCSLMTIPSAQADSPAEEESGTDGQAA